MSLQIVDVMAFVLTSILKLILLQFNGSATVRRGRARRRSRRTAAAAAAATEGSARVLVVERARSPAARRSSPGGYVWTATDRELEEEDTWRVPAPRAPCRRRLRGCDGWLAAFAAPLTAEQPNLHGRGRKFDLPLLVATMTRRLYAAGGRVWVSSDVTDVRRTAGGFDSRVRRDGSTAVVRAARSCSRPAVVRPIPSATLAGGDVRLCCLRCAGTHTRAATAPRIAAALGAQTNFANKGFDGHLFADGVEPIAPLDFIAFALYHSEEGVLFDAAGRRFADETRGDHNNTMARRRAGRPCALAVVGGGAGACGRPAVRRRKPADGPLGLLARPRRPRRLGGRCRGAPCDRARLGL